MKTCKDCKRELDSSEFYRSATSADGLLYVCKVCWRARVKARRRNNPAVQAYDRDRAKRPERVAKSRVITKRFRTEKPEAYKAQTAVGNALRDGKLKREPCLFCQATARVHAHHKDYSRPLDVIWLCAKCHHRLHANFEKAA